MSDNIRATLQALKDVQGIQGSFVLGSNGALLAMEMPALFEASMFSEIGPRIERLSESFASLGDELESCLLRFSDHLLHVRRLGKSGLFCVLSTTSVNLPALRMATNLAQRRLAGEMARATSAPVPDPSKAVEAKPAQAASPAPVAAADPPPAAAPVRGTPRYYRGHLVED